MRLTFKRKLVLYFVFLFILMVNTEIIANATTNSENHQLRKPILKNLAKLEGTSPITKITNSTLISKNANDGELFNK